MTDGFTETHIGAPAGLLGQAALTLRANGYATRYVAQAEGQLLLASNQWFIIGVAQFDSLADLALVESSGSTALSEEMVDVGPLRWDAYLLLLTSNARDHDDVPPSVAEITYNTQYHRRLIKWGVLPTADSISVALGPFLALQNGNASEPMDPVRLIATRMQLHGVSADQAESALAEWITDGRPKS